MVEIKDVYEHDGQFHTGYLCELYQTPEGEINEFRIAKHSIEEAGYVLLGSIDYGWDSDNWYWMRMNVIGNEIKAKIWEDGEDEPEDWDIEVEDDEFVEGIAGVGNFNQDGERYYDFVGFGFYGDEVPVDVDVIEYDYKS